MIAKAPKNLKRTIAIYFILANIIAGLVAFGGAAYNFYWQIRDMTLKELQQAAEGKAAAISDWLRLAVMSGSHYSSIEASRRYLEEYYAGTIDQKALKESCANIFGGRSHFGADIKGLARFDRLGGKFYELGDPIPANFWPPLSIGQKKPLINLFSLDVTAPPALLISTPILGQDDEFLGLDIVSLDTGPLSHLTELGDSFSFSGKTYLIGRENRTDLLIFSSPVERNWHPPADVRQVLALADEKDKATDRAARASALSFNGRGYGLGQVEGAEWRIVITIDEGALYEPVTRQMKKTTQLFLMFFSIALLGLWFFALKPLTNEVGEISEALEEQVEEATEKFIHESEGRKKTESRLVVATHRAQAAKLAKNQFLINLSHEIRTPLNAVIGMTDLALFTELNDEQRAYLGEVKKAADQLLNQINDLLDLSKLEDGLMVTESRDFNLKALLTGISRHYEALGRNKNLAYALRVDEAIGVWRRGDALRLRQVLNFLLDNAFKFTSAGGVELLVRPAGGDDVNGSRLEFLIRDTGIGIAADRLESIFDPFTQADATLTRTSGGTGLGLAVTRRLTELMGGIISVESVPGQGSLFHVALDLPKAKDREEVKIEPLSEEELKGRLAVLADDNEINRTVLKNYLCRWGLEVHAFESGSEVLDFFKSRPEKKPDILLMDSLMPGLSADELQAALEGQYPNTPLIFLSSSSTDQPSKKRPGGARTVFMDKPVLRETLGERLRWLLAEAGGRRAAPVRPAPEAGRLTKTENPRKILVVDDNQLNQKLASTLLTKRGHLTSGAANGQEALTALEAGGFDLALMDIQMPVMDGLTAVRLIRENPEKYGAGLPVVAMTAHALPGDQETFMDAGMTGYISKPFKPQDLIATVEQQFEKSDKPSQNGGPSVAVELNRAAILENFMDDEELLFESIDLFLERIAARMTELRKAVAAKDPEVFMPEAHTIKGMIGIFSTEGPFECAKKLELKGREKKTEGIDEDLKSLENEVDSLVAALRAWRSE